MIRRDFDAGVNYAYLLQSYFSSYFFALTFLPQYDNLSSFFKITNNKEGDESMYSNSDGGGSVKWVVLGIVATLVVVLLFGSCSIVPPGHRGVMVTLGSVSEHARGEGIAFKIPFISTVNNVTIQQSTQVGKAACFSSDLQTMEITYNVLFKIPERNVVMLFQQYAGSPYEALIVPRVNERLKEVTAKYKAEEAVKSREKIKAETMNRLIEAVGDTLVIVDFVINNIDLSNDLEKAIEAKQVEEQRALAKSYELQKEVKEAEITMVKARAEADAVKIKGEAIKACPEVIQLETVKKWDGKAPLAVGAGQNILLPLPK